MLRSTVSLLLPVAVVTRLTRILSVLIEARLAEARLTKAGLTVAAGLAGCVGGLFGNERFNFHVERLVRVLVLAVHQLGVDLLRLPVQTEAGGGADHAGDDEEAVAPRDDVEVRTGHPRPVLTQHAEHKRRDEDRHGCGTETSN